MLNDPTQPIFRALADPTRRAILKMLADQARPVNEIAAAFDMSRPAVAKHLAILKQGGLIMTQAKGRERINHINPDALKSAADWLNYFDSFWDTRLANLKKAVEKKK